MALNDVPLTGQTLNTTRPLIKQNFITFIDDQFKVDHKEFNTGADSGKHKGIHLIAGALSPVIGAEEVGIYNTVTGGVPALMLQAGSAGTAVDITGSSKVETIGYCRLSGGILVKWGYSLSPTRNSFSTAYSFNDASVPNFSAQPFHMQVTTTFQTGAGTDSGSPRSLIIVCGQNSSAPYKLTKDQFFVYHKAVATLPSPVYFYWIALGLG